ncbi:hypothetical protein [Rickettsia endosymbiont of Cardiosporidium cionae]|uniref:hypothetical protein n=1 Tax=Rickettsia endosymbiont of Cardiosporidium cionae TaxID=2777155 RepID=UPI001893237B|nr:hypothetical protein [Rickettsia endosymbiont of Cardiosporidium cionae]KAF8818774.1 hypothetical protein IHI24_000008 [Rickettsia endosymbiont of Cardiosporidium cionae]
MNNVNAKMSGSDMEYYYKKYNKISYILSLTADGDSLEYAFSHVILNENCMGDRDELDAIITQAREVNQLQPFPGEWILESSGCVTECTTSEYDAKEGYETFKELYDELERVYAEHNLPESAGMGIKELKVKYKKLFQFFMFFCAHWNGETESIIKERYYIDSRFLWELYKILDQAKEVLKMEPFPYLFICENVDREHIWGEEEYVSGKMKEKSYEWLENIIPVIEKVLEESPIQVSGEKWEFYENNEVY